MNFQLLKTDHKTKARLGILTTAHGKLETPFFMPVGTNATVKGLSSLDLKEMGSGIVLSNTYHLYLRPGMEVIKHYGGLHEFMNWDRVILTDSGGYQVFSLSKLRKMSDQGVEFQSHIDGSRHLFTPEKVMEIENVLGSDMIMPLDDCAPFPCDREMAEESVRRTTQWAMRSKEAFAGLPDRGQLLFGIIQGSTYADLRELSARQITGIGFSGYAIGGVSVGESVPLMFTAIDQTMPYLPENYPRYLMGIGLPDQIVRAVGEGIDMFDTVIPTRYGRHGSAFTRKGRIIILNAEFTKDLRPLDEQCGCQVCQNFSRGYLRHLIKAGEILGLRLVSYHNVHFYIQLLVDIRKAIKAGSFAEFQKDFLAAYRNEPLNTDG